MNLVVLVDTAADFTLDVFALLIGSLHLGSDWKFVVRGARSRLPLLVTLFCLVQGAASAMPFLATLVCLFACGWRFDLLSYPPLRPLLPYLAISAIRC